MASKMKRICEYCSTINQGNANNCLACGAPLPPPVSDPMKVAPAVKSKTKSKPTTEPTIEIRKSAEKMDEAYFMIWNTYALAWRTVGEAIAIALTAFILGLTGGATGVIFPGILGSVMVGFAVGFTRKSLYIVLISAPGGLLLGLALGALVWVLGGGPQVMVYTGLVFAFIGAVLGGKRSFHYLQRNCWEKARPFLGAAGGLVFGLIGTLIGWGLLETVQAIINLQP